MKATRPLYYVFYENVSPGRFDIARTKLTAIVFAPRFHDAR